jgi:DNA-3-methyladenine glycosylase I
MTRTVVGIDGKRRCHWCAATPEYIAYHDTDWGFPVDDDRRLFEKLCLEGFQSGLSWRTILAKRDNFRAAFRDFDFDAVARFTARDVQRLLKDAGIVRHRGKTEAVIHNARRAREMVQREGSLAAFFWTFAPDAKDGVALSKELKKRGWRFVGPTTVYAFLQAMGRVNDHAETCAAYAQAEKACKKFRKREASRNAHRSSSSLCWCGPGRLPPRLPLVRRRRPARVLRTTSSTSGSATGASPRPVERSPAPTA